MNHQVLTPSGLVANVVVLDPASVAEYSTTLPDGYTLRQETPENVSAPRVQAEVPVPEEVGSGQIRAAMIMRGWAANDDALDALIESAIDEIQDVGQREVARTLWRNASTFKRPSPFIAAVGPLLGKSSTEIDAVFVLAPTI